MMFNSRDIDPLMREKEHGRSQPLRGFSHRRTPPVRTHSDSSFAGRFPSNMWGRAFNGRDSSHDSYGFGSGGDFPEPWRSMSPSGGRDLPTTSQPRPGAYQQDRRMTFETAISNMISALQYANEGLQKIERTFTQDTASLKLWLPAQHLASLWMIYTAWNGIPTTTSPKNPSELKVDGTQPATPTFADVTFRISKALTGLRNCSPPDEFGGAYPLSAEQFSNSGSSGLGWHVLRTTMRKLEISFEAIEELIALTRAERDRLPALRHEVKAALQLLEGIGPELKSRAKATLTPAREREIPRRRTNTTTTDDVDDEYDWPNCGSI